MKSLVRGIPPPENKLYYPALDGLRAVAVLLVFLGHYRDLPPWGDWTWAGVDIFFVLSGFLITGILLDTRDSEHRLRNFYVRRTLRIFPVFYGVILVTLLLTPLAHWAWHPGWLLWPAYLGNYGHLLYPDNATALGHIDRLVIRSPLGRYYFGDLVSFGHLWSLCVEEQFYLVWPFVVFAVRSRRRLMQICLAAVVVVPFLRLAANLFLSRSLIERELLYRATPFRVDALLLGGLLALLIRGPEAEKLARYARPVGVGAFVLFLLSGLAGVGIFHDVPGGDPLTGWVSSFGYSFIDIMAASVLVLALRSTSLLYRVLTVRPLRYIGQLSYGFYVLHDILHPAYVRWAELLFAPRWHPYLMGAVVAFVCTLLLSYLSFRFVESPFLRLKDRFTVKPDRLPAIPAISATPASPATPDGPGVV